MTSATKQRLDFHVKTVHNVRKKWQCNVHFVGFLIYQLHCKFERLFAWMEKAFPFDTKSFRNSKPKILVNRKRPLPIRTASRHSLRCKGGIFSPFSHKAVICSVCIGTENVKVLIGG